MKLEPPPDWRVPAQTLVIATVARSGSNFLCDLLTQTGRLGRPDEFFGPHLIAARFPGRGQTPDDCCRLVRDYGMSENGVAAIKLFPEHVRSLQYSLDFTAWFGAPRFVRLRRRDILGQAISFAIALETLSFRSDEPVQREPRYAAHRIWRRLRQITGEQRFWDLYFARQAEAPLDIWYEDLAADPLETLRRIAGFMSIGIDLAAVAPGVHVRRQATGINEEWRKRFVAETGGAGRWVYPEDSWLDRIRLARRERRLRLRLRRQHDTVEHRRRRHSADGRIIG